MPLAEGEKLILPFQNMQAGGSGEYFTASVKRLLALDGSALAFYQDIRIRLIVFKPPVKA